MQNHSLIEIILWLKKITGKNFIIPEEFWWFMFINCNVDTLQKIYKIEHSQAHNAVYLRCNDDIIKFNYMFLYEMGHVKKRYVYVYFLMMILKME